jgi:hypothetical protein
MEDGGSRIEDRGSRRPSVDRAILHPPSSSFQHVRQHWAVFASLAAALAIWCAVDVSRRARVDPQRPSQHMTDVTVYTEAGRAFFDGRDPYEVTNIRGWKYLYPPLFALLIAPLAHFTSPWQASAWFAASVLMGFGSYFECRRLLSDLFTRSAVGISHEDAAEFARIRSHADHCPNSRRVRPRALFAFVCTAAGVTAMLPALNCLQRGQMAVALLYPLLLGFRLIATGRRPFSWFAAGTILALPIALKLTPALPVACMLLVLLLAVGRRGRTHVNCQSATGSRTRQSSVELRLPEFWRIQVQPRIAALRAVWTCSGVLAGGMLYFLLIPASLVGWDKNLACLHTWHEKVLTKVNDVRTDDFAEKVDSPRNQSLSNAVFRFGNWIAFELAGGPDDQVTGKANGLMPMDAPLVSQILLVVRGLALLTLLGVATRASRSEDRLLWAAALGLSCVATFVVSPVARGHYFVLILPAVLFVPLWLLQCGKPREAIRAALIPAVLVVLHYALLKYAGRIGVLGIGTTFWYFAACFRVTFGREELGAQAELAVQLQTLSRAA